MLINSKGKILQPISLVGSGKKKKQKQRVPQSTPEGITTANFDRAVSVSQIEVLDLISEGPIEGLVTGELVVSGNIGDLGYSSVTENLYSDAPGTNVKWLRSIFWNETPLVDSENRFNFQQISVSSTNGGPNGAVISTGNTNLTVARNVSERLRGAPSAGLDDPQNSDFSKIYRITNRESSGIVVNVRVNQLFETIRGGKKAGDIIDATVLYKIYYRPIFNDPNKEQDYVLGKSEEITGHITNGYIRSSEINFENAISFVNDKSFQGWEIKIIRSTPDSDTSSLRNQTFVDSLVELYRDTFTYPNSAIIRGKFNAEFFNQVPSRFFRIRGLKVRVPTNYDPIKKTYGLDDDAPAGLTDFWAGEFKEEKQWSDNPAWCFYELLTNRRFGLGKFINPDFVDKFTLYEIAKYCDTLVVDGQGGVEPRFSANLALVNRSEAFKVLNDMASIFRGMLYYASSSIFAVADQPQEPIFIFTNANVENGDFNYSSSGKKTRDTVALVRYNDKNNFYKSAVEYVEDIESIKKFGIKERDLLAFGCTSRGQAIRLGRWALFTANLETESVAFNAGLEAQYLRPGMVIGVTDQHRVGKRFGGRIFDIDNSEDRVIVTLDSEISLGNDSIYNFSLLTPSSNLDTTLDNITGSNQFSEIRKSFIQTLGFTGINTSPLTGSDEIVRTQIDFTPKTLNTGDYTATGNLIWAIELLEGTDTSDIISGQVDKYRVLSITEEDINKYAVSAIEYSDDKFIKIESGLSFQSQSAPIPAPQSPANLQLIVSQITTNTKQIDYSFTVADDSNIANFYVYVKKDADFVTSDITTDNTFLVDVLPNSSRNGSYIPTSDGTYYFRVYSRNSNGVLSASFASNNVFIGNVNPVLDITISSLTNDDDETTNQAGTALEVVTDDTNPVFTWLTSIAEQTLSQSDITYRITVREQSSDNNPSDTIYFEQTGYTALNEVSPDFTFELDTNIASVDGPHRNYDLVVESHDSQGKSSAGGNFTTDVNSLGDNDSLFTNANGYDIVRVFNPRVTGFRLTDIVGGETCATSLTLGITCTDQYISTAGSIVLNIRTGIDLKEIEDFAGLLFFYDTGTFTQADASGNLVPFEVVRSNDPDQIFFEADVDWEGVKTGYLAVAPFDFFDTDITTGDNFANLEVSNVVQILERGAFDPTPLLEKISQNTDWIQNVSGRVNILESAVSGLVGTDSDIILDYNNSFVLIDSSSSSVNVHLPDVSGVDMSGKSLTIKDWRGTSEVNNILILPTGEQFIDNFTGIRMNVNFESFTFLSNGTGWSII